MVTDTIDLLIIFMSLSDNSYHISRLCLKDTVADSFPAVRDFNKSAACFYLDIFSTQNLQEFVSLLGRSVLGKLDTLSQSTLKSLFSFFKSCRPVISADEITGMPSVTLDFIPERSEETLKEIFTYLNQSGVECYIAIDEFQQIMEYPEKGVEGLLRSYGNSYSWQCSSN